MTFYPLKVLGFQGPKVGVNFLFFWSSTLCLPYSTVILEHTYLGVWCKPNKAPWEISLSYHFKTASSDMTHYSWIYKYRKVKFYAPVSKMSNSDLLLAEKFLRCIWSKHVNIGHWSSIMTIVDRYRVISRWNSSEGRAKIKSYQTVHYQSYILKRSFTLQGVRGINFHHFFMWKNSNSHWVRWIALDSNG